MVRERGVAMLNGMAGSAGGYWARAVEGGTERPARARPSGNALHRKGGGRRVTDPRTDLVGRGYDVIGEHFAEWRDRIVGDPRREWEEELVSRLQDGARVLELGCGAGVPDTQPRTHGSSRRRASRSSAMSLLPFASPTATQLFSGCWRCGDLRTATVPCASVRSSGCR
jgi:hypothetical protein